MTSPNMSAIRDLYAAFGSGDIPAVLATMDPEIVWYEAENFPYADRNPYTGPQAILEGVFARCGSEWDGFAVNMDTLIDAGDTIIATGRYAGTYKKTGQAINPQAVHIWTMKDGKAVHFQQHIDTLDVAVATGAAQRG